MGDCFQNLKEGTTFSLCQLHGGNKKAFYPRNETKISILPTSFCNVWEGGLGEEKEIKACSLGKKNKTVFAQDIILYIGNLKQSTTKHIQNSTRVNKRIYQS